MRCAPAGLMALVVLMGVVPAEAQVRASERGGAFQTVNGTTITVEYSRPAVRGRDAVYGGQIPWGEVWTPGANWATTLEVDHDVSVNGTALAKGKYSVWMEVQPVEWTVVLDPRARMFHIAHPKPDSTQVRFPVTPKNISGPDLLTWSFTEVSPGGTILQMAWAGKSVAIQIAVPPVRIPAISAAVAARYVGRYEMWWVSESNRSTLDVTAGDDKLMAAWSKPPFAVWTNLTFVKVGDDWFHPGATVDGELFDVVKDVTFEFAVANGKATGFEIRGPTDLVIGRGNRIP